MDCTECGNPIEGGWKYCGTCGKEVVSDTEGSTHSTRENPEQLSQLTEQPDKTLPVTDATDERDFVCKPIPYWLAIAIYLAASAWTQTFDLRAAAYSSIYFLVGGVVLIFLSMARARDFGRSFVWGFLAFPVLVVPGVFLPIGFEPIVWWWPWSFAAVFMTPAFILGLFRSAHPGKNWV